MGITDLVTGGMGTLGQGIGQGVEGALTQRDYDALAQYVDQLFKSGVSPQQAVQLANQRFPGLVQGGGQGGAAPVPQAPRPQVPGLNQGSVVMNAVPMQGANPLGSLGAPQPQPQSQPQTQQPMEPPISYGGQRAPADNSMSRTSPGMSPPQVQLMQQAPQQAPQPQQAAPSPQSAPAPAQGMAGVITPRNMPLAQLLLQQQTNRVRASEAANSRVQVAETNLERDKLKTEAAMAREKFKADARAGIVSAQLQAKLQQFDQQNQTDIWQSLLNYQAKRAAIQQSGVNAQARNNVMLELFKSNNALLGRLGIMRGMDPELDVKIDQLEADQDALKLVVGGMQTVPGPEKEVPGTPGVTLPVVGEVGGTPPSKKPGKPKTVIKGSGAGPAAPSAQDLINKRNQRRSSGN